MATTYTAQAKLAIPANGDRSWDVPLVANINALDGINAIGALCVTLKETPSSSLNVSIAAGSFSAPGGLIGSYAGAATQGLTASSTNYIFLTVSATTGTLVVNTTGWPVSTTIVRLATVVTGTTTVTSVTDARLGYRTAGALESLPLAASDGSAAIVVNTGPTHGVQFGSATTDKVGFFGAVPVIQPSGSAQAAVGALATQTLTVSTGGTASAVLAAATNTGTLVDSTGGSASLTLAAISDGPTANAVASLAAQLAAQKTLNTVLINGQTSLGTQVVNIATDLATVKTLLNALRAAGVSLGAWKGSS